MIRCGYRSPQCHQYRELNSISSQSASGGSEVPRPRALHTWPPTAMPPRRGATCVSPSTPRHSLALLAVIEHDGVVVTAGDDGLAIGAEVEAVDLVRVLTEDLGHAEAPQHVVRQLHPAAARGGERPGRAGPSGGSAGFLGARGGRDGPRASGGGRTTWRGLERGARRSACATPGGGRRAAGSTRARAGFRPQRVASYSLCPPCPSRRHRAQERSTVGAQGRGKAPEARRGGARRRSGALWERAAGGAVPCGRGRCGEDRDRGMRLRRAEGAGRPASGNRMTTLLYPGPAGCRRPRSLGGPRGIGLGRGVVVSLSVVGVLADDHNCRKKQLT